MTRTLNVVKVAAALLCLGLLSGRAAVLEAQRKSNISALFAVQQFSYSLSPEQKAKAMFDFNDPLRVDWGFEPRTRKGLALKDMSPKQRSLVEEMLKAILSAKGLAQLNHVRNDLEGAQDPDLYYVSLFGTAGDRSGWSWRFEGDHVSLNFTMIGGQLAAVTPHFFGASPAEVASGPHQGLRTLGEEEDSGFALLRTLDDQQKKTAVIQAHVPDDIVTSNRRTAAVQSPAGLTAAGMTEEQTIILRSLINEHVSRLVDEIAVLRLQQIDATGFDKISFVWIGADVPNEPHYYRVQGPTFLIEFGNVRGQANHIHSVWRDLATEWGDEPGGQPSLPPARGRAGAPRQQ